MSQKSTAPIPARSKSKVPLRGDPHFTLAPAMRAVAFDQVISDGLPSAAAAAGALYTYYAWDHLCKLPPHASGIMSGVASITAVVTLLIYLFARGRRYRAGLAHPLAAALAACVLVNSLAHMYLLAEPDRTINLGLLIIAIGCFFLSARWVLLTIGATCIGWLLVAWLVDPGGGLLRWDYTLFKATVLALVFHFGRVRTYSRLEGLRLTEVETKRALEQALVSAQEARESAECARKRAEEISEALQQAHDELESKVAQRTAELAHSNAALRAEIAEGIRSAAARQELELQLRQSQKMEAVGKLAGGVAHDFNNMLAVINGYSELALMTLPSGHSMRAQLEEIRRAGERAAGLTRQLLAFSRRQMLQPKVLALDEVVSGMHQMFHRLIGEDIELVNITHPRLWRVLADPSQMEQVILNLAVNARDAMPNGGQLTYETRNVTLDAAYAAAHPGVEPGDYVLLRVRDTGHGMDPETQSRIFEPFFTTKELGKGTGLGLPTVYGIISQSGGHIDVSSQPEQGACFEIYLPRHRGPDPPQERSLLSALPQHGAETVLVVEDETMLRTLIHSVLQSCGYHVLAAQDGAEALRLLEQPHIQIDLLLTDVVMPRLGGRELAQRAALLQPRMRVLFMSGYTDDAVVRHGVHASEARYIQKPFSTAELTRRIRALLDEPLGATASPV